MAISILDGYNAQKKQAQSNADQNTRNVWATNAIKQRLASMQGPTVVPLENDAYKAKDYSTTPLSQYDAERSQLTQQYNQQRSAGMDAMDRRFAAMGNQNTGAHEVAAQQLETQMGQGRDQANLGINQQENQARMALNQQEQGKEFQSAEAQKGRNTAIQQYNNQAQQAYNQFQFEGQAKIQALDMASQQADYDRQTTEFNKSMQQYQQAHSGGLLGAGGFLGTGL